MNPVERKRSNAFMQHDYSWTKRQLPYKRLFALADPARHHLREFDIGMGTFMQIWSVLRLPVFLMGLVAATAFNLQAQSTITSVSPSFALMGAGGFYLIVTGTN